MSKARKRGSRPLPKVSLLVLLAAGQDPVIGGAYATPAAATSAADRYPARVKYAVHTLVVGQDQFLTPRIERMERVDDVDVVVETLLQDWGPAGDPGPLPLEVTNHE